MKYLGIDYGTKRIGIAISDDSGSFAFPKEIIDAIGAVARIEHIVRDEKIERIVIGHSIASNGIENILIEQVNRFKERLIESTGLPISLEREDFSSFEAHRYQTKAGNRDDSAAAIILQRFLDKNPQSA